MSALFDAASQHIDALSAAWIATVSGIGVIAAGTLGWDAVVRWRARRRLRALRRRMWGV